MRTGEVKIFMTGWLPFFGWGGGVILLEGVSTPLHAMVNLLVCFSVILCQNDLGVGAVKNGCGHPGNRTFKLATSHKRIKICCTTTMKDELSLFFAC